MSEGVGVVGLYVRDQDEAIEFYEKLGLRCTRMLATATIAG